MVIGVVPQMAALTHGLEVAVRAVLWLMVQVRNREHYAPACPLRWFAVPFLAPPWPWMRPV